MGSKYHKPRAQHRVKPLKLLAFLAFSGLVAFVLSRNFQTASDEVEISAAEASTFPFAETDKLQTAPEDVDAKALQTPLPVVAKPSVVLPESTVTVKPSGMYALEAKDIDGQFQALSQYADRVTLVVNMASKCGYTISNYQGLEELYGKFKERGFVVMGFPCNQFGGQEPANEAGIKDYVSETFGVTFPMFSKVDVNGANAHPVYAYIKEAGPDYAVDVEWNFVKFLVDREGRVVKRFKSSFDRDMLEQSLEQYL